MSHRITVVATPGVLPADGPCSVGDLDLPEGAQQAEGRVWVTTEAVPSTGEVWVGLAQAFSVTGLWPVVLTEPGVAFELDVDDPTNHDALALLKADAPATLDVADPTVAYDLVPALPGEGRIALVPVIEPADVVARTGWTGASTGTLSTGEVSAVLRSWQRRYGAVPLALGADTLFLLRGAVPEAGAGLEALASEHEAFCPQNFEGISREAYLRHLGTSPVWAFRWA